MKSLGWRVPLQATCIAPSSRSPKRTAHSNSQMNKSLSPVPLSVSALNRHNIVGSTAITTADITVNTGKRVDVSIGADVDGDLGVPRALAGELL